MAIIILVMPKFTIDVEGVRGEGVKRFAALANKTAEELIVEWIKDKVDHVAVQAMRAEGMNWEAIAEALGNSTTQARRIYAQGIDMPLVSKETIRILERYVSLIEQAADVKLPVPTQEDLDMIEAYINALPSEDDMKNAFPVPNQEDLDMIEQYNDALPDTAEINFPVPSEEDIEAVERFSKATAKE
jgi:hypothetical protein